MSTLKVGKDRAGNAIKLYYQDFGKGKPVVLIHGWPLSSALFDYQLAELPNHNLRVIAYDRRGFGQSSKPWDGYDYDTLADDLHALLEKLDLKDVTLVGMSMGGGEVARYMSRHKGKRIGKVVFLSAVTPFLLKTADNPNGIDKSVFDEIGKNIQADRAAFLKEFGKNFYGVGTVKKTVSQAHLDGDFVRAYAASHKATYDCMKAWSETDFRADLKTINVPTLVMHGDKDAAVPIEISGELTAKAIPNAKLMVYKGASHGAVVTHKDEVIRDLLAFVG